MKTQNLDNQFSLNNSPTNKKDIFTKVSDIKNYLNSKFVERDEIIHMMFVCLIARQHMLLIGSPGTAKSALIKTFSKQIEGNKYFSWLLTKFTTPEELFGPVSLKELEQGVYKRITTGKLPESYLTFLDEIFKSSSAILNSLLTAINEREFYNNGAPTKIPLMSVFGGSNEYPEEGEGLEALFDRFLIRFEIDYIAENNNFFKLLSNNGVYIPEPEKIELDELMSLQGAAEHVVIPDEVLNVLTQIRENLANEGIRPSDRRFVESLSLLRANAILNGRNQVNVSDISILRNGLWENVTQKEKVIAIVEDFSVDKVQKLITTAIQTCSDLFNQVQATPTSAKAQEVLAKSKDMIAQLEKSKVDNPTRSIELEQVIQKIKELNQKVSDVMLGTTI